MKRLITICVVLIMAAATADATLIDFEAYANFQNLHGINLGGVTLTNPTNNIVEIFDNRSDAGYHSPTKVIGSFSSTSKSVNPIVGVFDSPQTYIALWAGDKGTDDDSWELEAFDSIFGGNSLGLVQSGTWSGDPYRKLEINAANIWRFEVQWTGFHYGIAYDDLEFIPEPTTICLLMLGGLALLRRKPV